MATEGGRMPKTVQTICVTLEPKYIDILKKIKEKHKKESMSDTFRFLLNWHEEREAEEEMKRQYDEYYRDGDPCKDCCAVFGKSKRRKPASAKATAGKRGAR